MRFLYLPLILIAVVLIASCSAAPAAPPTVAPGEPAQSLLPDIDVATAASLHGQSDVIFLDVRTPEEYAQGHIPGIQLIPLNELPNRLSEVPKDKTVVVTCRSGNRSNQAAQLLRKNGYDNVHNMLGGITDWQQAGYAAEK